AARTGQAEAHRPGGLSDVAAAVAFGTNHVGAALGPRARAGGARLLARDVQAHLRAFDGLPEIDAQPVLEIVALLRRGRFLGSLAEPLVEDVLKICAPTCAGRSPSSALPGPARKSVRKIEASETHARTARTRARCRRAVLRIEAVLIVHLLLFLIAQDVVSFLDLFEAILGGLIAGVQVGVMLAGQAPVGFTDFVRSGLAAHPECLVVILLRHTTSGQWLKWLVIS